MSLSPETVRAIVFDKAPIGKPGYHEEQVDDFLDKVESALEGTGSLTARQVRKAVFDTASRIKRGYHEDQVDAFLDLVADEFDKRAAEVPQAATPPATPLPVRNGTSAAASSAFHRPVPAPPQAPQPVPGQQLSGRHQMPPQMPSSPHQIPGHQTSGPNPIPGHQTSSGPHPIPGHQSSGPHPLPGQQVSGRHQAPAQPSVNRLAPPPTKAVHLALPPAPPGVRGYHPGDVDRLARALHHAATRYDGRPTATEIANSPMSLTSVPGQGFHPGVVDALIDAWTTELQHRESTRGH
jgi:DivIVA domain-containing protein